MKKLVLFAVVALATSMVSCGNKENTANAEAQDAAQVEGVVPVEEAAVVVDSIANDSTVVEEGAAEVVAE